ncbi:hypothetical protein KKC91_07065 [bacterium]|nr:hypothetical protein [bacterium]
MGEKVKYLKLVLLGSVCFLLAGCACVPGGISASSTPLNNKPYHTLGYTSATDSRFLILGFIPVTGSNSTRDALNEAIKDAGADALIDVTVEAYGQWFILFSRVVTKVEGIGIRFEHYKQEPENIGVKSKNTDSEAIADYIVEAVKEKKERESKKQKQKTDPEKTRMWDKIKID